MSPHGNQDYADIAADMFLDDAMERRLRFQRDCLKAACESYKEVMKQIAVSLEANPKDAASVRMANEWIWTEFVLRAEA